MGFTSAYHRVSDDSVSAFAGHPTLERALLEARVNLESDDIDHTWVRDEAREIVWDSDD